MPDRDLNDHQGPKESNQEFKTNDIHYRRLFETAQDGIMVVDAETGNVIDVNPFLIESLGYPRLDIINKPIWELGFLKKVFSDKNKFDDLKQKDYLPYIDLPLETATGDKLDAYLTGNSYEAEHRKLIQMHFQVIRERKEAESKLDQSERRLHQLIEEAPIGIALSQQGKTVYVNARYLQMFGFEKPEELLGTSFLDQVAPQSRVEILDRAMKQEQGVAGNPEYDVQGLRKDGSEFPFQASIAQVEFENSPALIGYFTDVTERKRAEEDLKESETKFKSAFMTGMDAFYLATLEEGLIIEVNDNFEKIWGYTKSEAIGRTSLELGLYYDPSDRASMVSQIKSKGYVKDMELKGRKKDGQLIAISISVSIMVLHGKNLILGIIRDITEYKNTEAELRAAEDKFRLLAENAQDLIFRYRLVPPSGYEYVSPSAVKLVGYSPEEYYNDPELGLKMIYPEDRARVEAAMVNPEVMPLTPIELRCIRKDGQIIWLEQINSLVSDSNGKAIAIQGVARDITNRKKIEGQLNNVLIHQQTILSAVPDIIMEVDKNKIYTWTNRAGLDFFGDDVVGKEASYYFVGDQDTYKIVQPVFDGVEENVYIESWQRRKDGQKRLLAWWSRSLKDAQGKVIGGLSAANDITDRVRSEQENQILRDKSEVSSRLAAVGEMAAGIAHEINNPLTGVIGFSEILMERTDIPDDVKADLQIINDGSTRVKEIVRRMLMFARQTKPNKSLVSIAELLDNTLELRSYVLKTSNIEVTREYDPNLPCVTADAGQLQQVFLNIIVNAEYAMKKAHDKGILTVKTEALENQIRVSISDNGPGMSDETKAKLFQPFFTTKEPGEGTGLGLSLSLGIVQEHFGTLRAESVLGKGTTFVIELPIIPAEIEPVKPHLVAHVSQSIKHAKVLVVDDEPSIRALIKTILTQDGYIVEECANSAQVLEKLEAGAFDIMLVDLRMPGMNGMELYGEISTRWPKLAHRVIFITGDTSDLNTRQYLATHQIPFISKPFERKTLESTVNAVLSGN